jgi:hypothetical protein
MIDAKVLRTGLTRLLKRLEDDLRERALSPKSDVPDLRGKLQDEWQFARDANRTAERFESWAEQVITQAGVHWLLSCVFLRFIEDNALVDRPWLSGTPQSGRLALARDRHDEYFRAHPHESDRDYLVACFLEAGKLPGLRTFFDEVHNPVFRLGISGDAAMAVMQFWQEVAADTGVLIRDFTDPTWNTRFLGDLYQHLSEATRKRYALLQTPEFVEEFILDHTLTPAIHEFGYRAVRMIDPTCGSGHFLLGGFHRIVDEWSRNEPGRNRRDIAQKALDAIAGIDLNPFAVAIARFRLLLAALKVSDVHRMTEALDFRIHVAIGDSLLHGTRFGLSGERAIATEGLFDVAASYAGTGLSHAYATEDLVQVQEILGQQYHAVVGNPPYILVKDGALNSAYRQKYASCRGKYSLGCPFTERFFELALTGRDGLAAGYVGLITTNAFMKREYGIALIQEVLPRVDLTHVLDTSRAHIPGHGTPTVIMFGRHRGPTSASVRAAMGKKGESKKPIVPADGPVWRAICDQIDVVGSESPYITVTDVPRSVLSLHPWSLGGGGAAELKSSITSAGSPLSTIALAGIGAVTLSDDSYQMNWSLAARQRIQPRFVTNFVVGDAVREWSVDGNVVALIPHSGEDFKPELSAETARWLWPMKTGLSQRLWFKKTQVQRGHEWYAYGHISVDKFRVPLALAVAFLATHTQAAFLRDRWVCNRTAPMIKLRGEASEDKYLGLLGILNSSVACFWLKHTLMDRGGGGIGGGLATESWEKFYEHDGGKLEGLPIVVNLPIGLARTLDSYARQLERESQLVDFDAAESSVSKLPTRQALTEARDRVESLRRSMIAWQEELDWHCYRLYGLLPASTDEQQFECNAPPELKLGERAFEIVLARRIAAGVEETTWFERHGSSPVLELPSHWPESYRNVVQRRIDLIEDDANMDLIERPEYKRRWNWPTWDSLEHGALQEWLLDRLEAASHRTANVNQVEALISTSRLADVVLHDSAFMLVASLYAGRTDFDAGQLVADLVVSEAVPFLPVLRYTDTGIRKRAQWEDTWAQQRRLDAREDVDAIPVPPDYKSKDFLSPNSWRLRGSLDLPKERWVSYPGCERGADGSLVISWAGWDHSQQARALATYFVDMKEREGWSSERLQPLLAGLVELVPWLKQWHNDMNPDFGARMGDYYEAFVNDEARALQFTLDDLRAWKPAATTAKRGRKKVA